MNPVSDSPATPPPIQATQATVLVAVGSFDTPGARVDLNWSTSNHPFHTIHVADGGAFYPERDLTLKQARAAGQAVAELDRRVAAQRLADDDDVGFKLQPPNEGTKEPTHSCEECHWSNTNLLNLGEEGKPRWVCHGCLKRAIEQRDALADQTPQVDPPQLPSLTAHLNTYSDHYLVSRAIECCMHYTRPLWAVVADRFGLESTSAKHLCDRFGFSSNDTKFTKTTATPPTTQASTAKPALGPRPAYIAAEFRIQELAQAIDRAATTGQVDLRLVDHACDLRNLVIEEAIRRSRKVQP